MELFTFLITINVYSYKILRLKKLNSMSGTATFDSIIDGSGN